MIYPADFVSYLCKRSRGTDEEVVLARIALNVLYDPDPYPVDVHEIMGLRNESRIMAEAFLAFCAINPDQYSSWNTQLCEPLFAICADGRKEQSEEVFRLHASDHQSDRLAPQQEQQGEAPDACV